MFGGKLIRFKEHLGRRLQVERLNKHTELAGECIFNSTAAEVRHLVDSAATARLYSYYQMDIICDLWAYLLRVWSTLAWIRMAL